MLRSIQLSVREIGRRLAGVRSCEICWTMCVCACVPGLVVMVVVVVVVVVVGSWRWGGGRIGGREEKKAREGQS